MERNVRRKRFLRVSLMMLVAICCLWAVYGIPVKAEPVNTSQFEYTDGVIRYIIKSENYYLDMKKPGLMDISYLVLQFIANLFWGLLVVCGRITTVLFYFCMDFNLAELFGSEINALQASLVGSVFQPLFSLGFCGALIVVLKDLLRRDSMGILVQFGKVTGVWVLSMLLVNHTGTALEYATGITKSVSAEILLSMAGGSVNDTESYAVQMANVIWNATVHQPWVYIEFMGTDADEETIEIFLESAPKDSLRERLVEADQSGAFEMWQMLGKISFVLAYMIPFIIKCLIYIVLSVTTLAYQFFAVFYTFLAPVMLILMLFPGYEKTLNVWLRKLVETQVSILMLVMILGLLVKLDDLLYTRTADSWGWLIVLVVQSGLELVVLIKRKDIIAGFQHLQKSVTNPAYAANMIRNGPVGKRSPAETLAMMYTVNRVIGAVGGLGKVNGSNASGIPGGGAARSNMGNHAALPGSTSGKAEISRTATAAARPKMSDCRTAGPVRGHLERTDVKTEPGNGLQARPSMDIKSSLAERPGDIGAMEAQRPQQIVTSLERPGTGQKDTVLSKAENGQEASATLPAFKQTPRQESEKQKKAEISGSTGKAAAARQKATQRREMVQAPRDYPSKDGASSRLYKERPQAAKAERPSSSVKKH